MAKTNSMFGLRVTPRTIRWALRSLAAVAVALSSVVVFSLAMHEKRTNIDVIKMIGERPFNELTRTAIEIKLKKSADLVQTGLLALGALWTLVVIGEKQRPRITLADWPEWVMLLFSSGMLITSLLWQSFYVDSISAAFAAAGSTCVTESAVCIPDVFDQKIEHQLTFQFRFIATGIIGAVMTLLSAHQLKGQ